MPGGALVEGLPEGRSQLVGLAIDQGFQKGLSLRLIQVQLHPAPGALQLVQHRLQGMGLLLPSGGYLLWAIGPQDQQAMPGQSPAQVKEQADGGRIRPL